MSEQTGHVVRIERTYAASAEDVFDAWTSPEVMRRWFHAGRDWDTPVAEVDLRVGGDVRVVMRRPDGSEAGAQGEYTLIDRPRRLVMTLDVRRRARQRAADRAVLLRVGRLDDGADGQQRDRERRAPRGPGPGLARVLGRARAGIGELKGEATMETHFAGDSAQYRTASERLWRIVPAIVLIAVASGCWAITARRMQGMDMGPGTDLGGVGWFAVVWTTMMAAMMLPSLVPMALTYAGASRAARASSPTAATFLFALRLPAHVARRRRARLRVDPRAFARSRSPGSRGIGEARTSRAP